MIKKLFTLVELIIVIVVIGLLSSITVAHISLLKEQANNTALKTNIHSVQTSTDMYRIKNNKAFPTINKPSEGSAKEVDFKKLIPDYARNLPKVHDSKYWIDHRNTVWGSFAEIPHEVDFDEINGTVSFLPGFNSARCEVIEDGVSRKKYSIETTEYKQYVHTGADFTNHEYSIVCYDKFDNPTPEMNRGSKIKYVADVYEQNYAEKSEVSPNLIVKDHHIVNGVYEIGEKLTSSITLENTSSVTTTLFILYLFEDDSAVFYDTPPPEITLLPNETKTFEITWDSSATSEVGFYDTSLAIYNSNWTSRLVQYKVIDNVYLYEKFDNWSYYTAPDWTKLDNRTIGGISTLEADNIVLTDRRIDINLPANSYSAGQAMTIQEQGYGSYEARMKVPDKDSILSGFFLYSPNDREHEVDIEILKQGGVWKAWFTVHNINHPSYNPSNGLEPGEIYKKEVILDFDPSSEFHNYRINLYPDYLSFEVDGKEIDRWNESFDYKNMQLYVSSFYPQWLEQNQSPEIKQNTIEWIRYGFFPK